MVELNTLLASSLRGNVRFGGFTTGIFPQSNQQPSVRVLRSSSLLRESCADLQFQCCTVRCTAFAVHSFSDLLSKANDQK